MGAALVPAQSGGYMDGNTYCEDEPGNEIRLMISCGLTDGALVSGTNVGVVGSAKQGPRIGGAPDPTTETVNAIPIGYELTIGTTVVSSGGTLGGGPSGIETLSDPGGLPPAPAPNYVVPVRFASTHFNHDSDIPITMKAEYKRQSRAYMDSSIFDLPNKTITHTWTVKAYNKVLAWKTTRDAYGQYPFSYQSVVDAVMVEGHKAFTAAKYATQPLALGPDLLNWGEIPAHAASSTAWFADSHGNSSGIQDSGVPSGSSGQLQTWATWATTAHPLKLAVAVAYACATMNSTNTIKTQVPIRTESGNWVDGAYLGFHTTIYAENYYLDPADPNSVATYTLDQHAKIFCEGLAAGLTIEDAMRAANQDAAAKIGTTRLRMDFVGDPNTTLKDVYLTSTQRSNLGLLAGQASGLWYYSGAN